MLAKLFGEVYDFFTYNFAVLKSLCNKKILKHNKGYENSAKTEEVFILFTGASLSGKDLTWLKKKSVIATNFFFLHHFFLKLEIEHYILLEPWQYRKQWLLSWMVDMIMLRSKKIGTIWLNISALPHFNKRFKHFHFERQTEFNLKNFNFKFLKGNHGFELGNVKLDISSATNTLSGTFYASIFLAIFLGYKKIYLLGSDHNKQPMKIGHFYDNDFSVWTNKQLDNTDSKIEFSKIMIKKIKAVIKFAKSRNVEIINILDDGEKSRFFKSIKFNVIKNL